MTLTFVTGWKEVLRRAYSIRLSLIAAFFSAVEVGFQYYTTGQPAYVAMAAVALSLSSAFSRLFAQQELAAAVAGAPNADTASNPAP